MPTARTNARKDSNHDQIVQQIEGIPGLSVKSVHQLPEFCDVVVGVSWFRLPLNLLIEIKDPSKPPSRRRLTPHEEKFHGRWEGQIDVAHTIEEILEIIEQYRRYLE